MSRPNPFAPPAPASAEATTGPRDDGATTDSVALRQRLFAAERAVVAWGRLYMGLAATYFVTLTLLFVGMVIIAEPGELDTSMFAPLGLFLVWLVVVGWVGSRLAALVPMIRKPGIAVGLLGTFVGPFSMLGIGAAFHLGGAEATEVLTARYATARRDTLELDASLLQAHRSTTAVWRRGIFHGRYGWLVALAALPLVMLAVMLGVVAAILVFVALRDGM